MTNLKDTLAYRYASAVMEDKDSFEYNGRIHNSRVSSTTRLSIVRFFADLEAGKFELNYKMGYLPIQFIENLLYHYKGHKAGQNFELEAWQHFYFMNLYGWIKDDGLRRFLFDYTEVARKNGKTALCGGRGIYHLIGEDEAGPQVYAGATKEDQARIVVNDSAKMIQKSPALKKYFKFQEHAGVVKSFYMPSKSGYFRALGQDSNTNDGFDPSLGIIDEYHEHKNTGTIDVIESGMVARKQPQLSIITTAGFNKTYPCFSVTRKSAIEVLKGTIQNDSAFYMIYTMDEADDYADPENWYKSNPNLGASVLVETLKGNYNNAKAQGSTKWINFLTKNLNIWTDAPDQWIDTDIIKANNQGITEAELIGAECFMGIDLGSSSDFSSVVLFFPNIREGVHAVKAKFFQPMRALRDRVDGYDFTEWKNEGYITISGEDASDHRIVAREIKREMDKYKVNMVGYDPYAATHSLLPDLIDAGLNCVPIRQTIGYLSIPTKEVESMMLRKELDLMNNPVLIWQFGNVVLKMDDNGNIKPNKGKSENKIDGVASLVNAVAVWMDAEANGSSNEILFGTI